MCVCVDRQRSDYVHSHHRGHRRLLCFAATTQHTTVSVAGVFHTTRGCPCAITVGLLQRSPGWTSCQSTQPTAVRSPRGSATDSRRPSLRPRYTTAAAAALAVSARTSVIQTLRHGVSLSSALNTSRMTSGSCPRFILVRDCARPPLSTS